jgi:hypothetical protein
MTMQKQKMAGGKKHEGFQGNGNSESQLSTV